MKFNIDDVISELDTQIRWIEEIDGHKFPGWCGVTMAMRYAMILLQKENDEIHEQAFALLKEQAEEIERLKKPTAGDNNIPLRW